MNVRWTDQANTTFRNQSKWLRKIRGEAAVTRYFEEVAQALEKLEKSEIIEYKLVDDTTGTRKLPVSKTVDLYYRVDEKGVELVAFFDNRQDPDKLRL